MNTKPEGSPHANDARRSNSPELRRSLSGASSRFTEAGLSRLR